MVKIRNQYNQVSHLTQDTIWESDKNTRIHHTQESQISPFPACDHKAARNTQDSLTKTISINRVKPISNSKLEILYIDIQIQKIGLTQ